jgi:hypothetical protein
LGLGTKSGFQSCAFAAVLVLLNGCSSQTGQRPISPNCAVADSAFSQQFSVMTPTVDHRGSTPASGRPIAALDQRSGADASRIRGAVAQGVTDHSHLPLEGSLVADHPTELLEFYQWNYYFSDPAALTLFVHSLKMSSNVAETTTNVGVTSAAPQPSLVVNTGGSFTIAQYLGPDDGRHERLFTTFAWNSHVLTGVYSEGGRALSWETARPIALAAAKRLFVACGEGDGRIRG